MTIGDILTEQARTRPGAVALRDDRAGRVLTFAELGREVGCAAVWWQAQGLRRGHAVLVFVPMSAELYVALLALFRIGAVALFLDPSAGKEHLERCCARWAPDALLAVPKAHLLRLRSGALRRIPIQVQVGACWVPGARRWPTGWCGEGQAENRAEPSDAALVTFTSGTTGEPKASVRTQGFLLAQYRALAPSIALEVGEVDLATLPVFVLANLAAGVTTVIPDVDLRRPGAVDGAKVWAQIERCGVTRITASPAFFERLIAHAKASGESLATLSKLYTGGAPVFPRLLEAMRGFAPNAEVVAVYGSTEAEPIAHFEVSEMSKEDLAAMRAGRGLLAGVSVSEVALRVVRDRWGEVRGELGSGELEAEVLPTGEVGEIVVTGDHVLKGYLGGVGDSETKFNVGGAVWHRTGDAGCFDEKGRLWLHGRCAARIDDERGRLYPFGVECLAMMFSEVRRAAALAHQEKRVLVIEADRSEVLEKRLLESVRWALIDEIIFVEAMPVDRRHNAKIDYARLRNRLGVSVRRDGN
jgi:acyl-CoA synthetase (AMP-forming)/AMP-acid ligase II